MSVNKVILLGNVGSDPIIRTTQDGNKIATFSIATSEKWKDKSSGEAREKTEWCNIVVYNKNLATIVESYIKKGTKVYIEGSLQTRKWAGSDNIEKYITEVILQGFNSKLEILDSRKDGEGNGSYSPSHEDMDSVPF